MEKGEKEFDVSIFRFADAENWKKSVRQAVVRRAELNMLFLFISLNILPMRSISRLQSASGSDIEFDVNKVIINKNGNRDNWCGQFSSMLCGNKSDSRCFLFFQHDIVGNLEIQQTIFFIGDRVAHENKSSPNCIDF